MSKRTQNIQFWFHYSKTFSTIAQALSFWISTDKFGLRPRTIRSTTFSIAAIPVRNQCCDRPNMSTTGNSSQSSVQRGGIDSDCMTLTRYVLCEQKKVPQATGELSQLLAAIQTAVKSVSSAVRRAGITQLFGTADQINVQGEDVKKLDVLANELFINLLKSSYSVAYMVSEENEDIIEVEEEKRGSYIVYFDPLDGSSNIDCLASIGSIFAVMKKQDNKKPTCDDVIQPGLNVIAAGYALYGSATMLVISIGNGVHGFMLDPTLGEFILTETNFQIPTKGKIYSINEGYTIYWDNATKKYIEEKKNPSDQTKPYNARYVGSMVADVHRTIKYGGIFIYPATKQNPTGKLRLLYECFPMAYLVTKAGGLACCGTGDILDLTPTSIHQRSPIILGSKDDVLEYQRFLETCNE